MRKMGSARSARAGNGGPSLHCDGCQEPFLLFPSLDSRLPGVIHSNHRKKFSRPAAQPDLYALTPGLFFSLLLFFAFFSYCYLSPAAFIFYERIAAFHSARADKKKRVLNWKLQTNFKRNKKSIKTAPNATKWDSEISRGHFVTRFLRAFPDLGC